MQEVARRLRAAFRGTGPYSAAEKSAGGSTLCLVRPLTFMNNSGTAVQEAVRRRGAGPDDLLIVYDDVSIGLGTIRLREQGGAGGHNGMASVIGEMGTNRIRRIRCGIGAGDPGAPFRVTADFVLSPFEAEEIPRVQTMIETAGDAVLVAATAGFAAAMNRFNTRD